MSGGALAFGEVLPPLREAGEERAANEPKRTGSKADRTIASRRFALLNTFADQAARGLRPAEQACWLQLFRHADKAGRVRLSLGRLADGCGVSVSTAQRAVKALIRAELLAVDRRGGLGRGASTYRLKRPG